MSNKKKFMHKCLDFSDKMDIIGVTPPGDTPYTQGINCS
jgi:hypothetical protein|tara:strand:- start:3205 stop:3321 length:117 start_codon:yes stop_codon:yes gene_type:complete